MKTSGLIITRLNSFIDYTFAGQKYFDKKSSQSVFSKLKAVKFNSFILIIFINLLTFSNVIGQQDRVYKVYMKTSQCSGRYDWISVAKEDPTPYGLSFHQLAGTVCDNGCTFEEAMRVAETRRFQNDFFNYCCRDYSVWYKNKLGGTREYIIVLGKFFTGEGYFFERGDLCCEEAEALAGIPGACSGRAQISCPPGSYSAWNPQTQKSECFCYPGFMWNNTKTACISFAPDCEKFYPNSVAYWDKATNQYLCNCKQGFVWNSTKTACIPGIPDCNSFYKNSVAVWDEASKQYLCNCPQGYIWNSNRTECILNIPDCNSFYKNSIAVWDEASKQYLCNCPQGYVWNATRTECIHEIPDCNFYYKNSVAVWDEASKQYLCNCPQGYVWNTNRTECILAIPDCNAFYKNSVAVWDEASKQYLCNCPQGYEWNAQRTECITSNGNRDNPYVNPQQQKPGECNVEYKSGANEPEQYTIDVKSSVGKLNFSYQTYSVKDRIHIYYGGSKVFDSGCVGTSGSQTLTLNGSSSVFTIIVDPKCDGDSADTNWNFTLGCPVN